LRSALAVQHERRKPGAHVPSQTVIVGVVEL
jgi:hypothetical protein